jgi:hypothetical protein
LARLVERSPDGRVLLGVDFPVGIPHAYALRAGLDTFRDLLRSLDVPPWANFTQLAESPEQISTHRPFYPFRPGGTAVAHLLNGLGLAGREDLLRRCERGSPRASPLFWTLGAKQVGRAALAGWRDLLVPALARNPEPAALWPFEGDLTTLLRSRQCVIAETYPADACVQLDLGMPGRGWKKTDRGDRAGISRRLHLARSLPRVSITTALRDELAGGFGDDRAGEDRFDAAIGLLAMLAVVIGRRKAGVPNDPALLAVEGWILGRSP